MHSSSMKSYLSLHIHVSLAKRATNWRVPSEYFLLHALNIRQFLKKVIGQFFLCPCEDRERDDALKKMHDGKPKAQWPKVKQCWILTVVCNWMASAWRCPLDKVLSSSCHFDSGVIEERCTIESSTINWRQVMAKIKGVTRFFGKLCIWCTLFYHNLFN